MDKTNAYKERCKDFFRIVARVFYRERDIVVMDAISHLYFVNQV